MRIKSGFQLHDLFDEGFIIAQGVENIDFGDIIVLNSSASWLWKQIQDMEFSPESLARLLVERYGIHIEQAIRDVTVFTNDLIGVGAVEE